MSYWRKCSRLDSLCKKIPNKCCSRGCCKYSVCTLKLNLLKSRPYIENKHWLMNRYSSLKLSSWNSGLIRYSHTGSPEWGRSRLHIKSKYWLMKPLCMKGGEAHQACISHPAHCIQINRGGTLLCCKFGSYLNRLLGWDLLLSNYHWAGQRTRFRTAHRNFISDKVSSWTAHKSQYRIKDSLFYSWEPTDILVNIFRRNYDPCSIDSSRFHRSKPHWHPTDSTHLQ